MARVSKKVHFSGEFFSTLVDREGTTVPEIAPIIGLTKQSLYENIKDNSITKDFLLKIAKHFMLDQKDFDLLMGISPLHVFFRRERREEVEEDKKDKIRELVEAYLKISQLENPKKYLPKFEGLTPSELALEIRSALGLDNYRVPFDDLVSTLKKFGVYTYFYPFNVLGLNEDSNKKRIRAASIPVDRNWIIFLDTSNELIDSLYDLLHELAHIFAGHKLESFHSDDLESYCNKVAAEVMTPSSFFKENGDVLKKVFSQVTYRIVGEAESIQFTLGCSFEGLVLALSENQIISSSAKKYLYAVNNKKKKNAITLNRYFVPVEGESFSLFWYKSLNDVSLAHLYEFFIRFKVAFLEGRATTRLLAQGFGLDISNGDVLCKKWIVDNEFSAEEIERFKDGPWQSF